MTDKECAELMARFESGNSPPHAECVDILLSIGAQWNMIGDLWETGSEGNSIGSGEGLPASEALLEWLRYQRREDNWDQRSRWLKATAKYIKSEFLDDAKE